MAKKSDRKLNEQGVDRLIETVVTKKNLRVVGKKHGSRGRGSAYWENHERFAEHIASKLGFVVFRGKQNSDNPRLHCFVCTKDLPWEDYRSVKSAYQHRQECQGHEQRAYQTALNEIWRWEEREESRMLDSICKSLADESFDILQAMAEHGKYIAETRLKLVRLHNEFPEQVPGR